MFMYFSTVLLVQHAYCIFCGNNTAGKIACNLMLDTSILASLVLY